MGFHNGWQAWYQAAHDMADHDLIDEAVRAMRQALQMNPEFPDGHLELGLLLAERGVRGDEPERCFDQAIRLAPDRPEPWFLLGHRLLGRGQVEEAGHCFRSALEVDPERPESIAGLARVLLHRGDPAAALALSAPLADVANPHPQVIHAYATSCRGMDRPEDAVVALRRVLAESILPSERRQLQLDLGDALDELGEVDEAFAAFKGINDQQEPRFDAQGHRTAVRNAIAAYSADAMARMPCSTRTSGLPVLIVGLPHSGTALVERILCDHLQVVGAGEKATLREIAIHLPHVAGQKGTYYDCFQQVPVVGYDALADVYLEALGEVDPQAERVTDRMAHSFLHLGLAAQLVPGARVVHCVRDPLDALWSSYRHASRPGRPWAASLESLGHYYLAYQELMAHWRKALPLSLFEVRYESLVTDPEPVIRDLVRFLGLDWDRSCLDRSPSALHEVGSPHPGRIHQRSVGRATPYRQHLEPLVQILENA
ncbi:MAG: sulfotransferase [Deltaproteobacteria bacterium]|nr:sulfotransferase [Deltaproteobacteria bacterium]